MAVFRYSRIAQRMQPSPIRELFKLLSRPGMVSFTCTRWGDLLNPGKMPAGEAPLTAAECYRFALSSPHIDVAIVGPRSDEEMAHSLSVLRSGPMDEHEMSRARAIGRHVHTQKSLSNWFR